jgi:hypothetical protein
VYVVRWRAATEATVSSYRVHRFDVKMAKDQDNLERFLNSLDGEVVAITPNVTMGFLWMHRVDFLFITERIEA